MDSMEVDDNIYCDQSLIVQGFVTQVNLGRGKTSPRCGTRCFALLCALLLAGNIGQVIYYQLSAHPTLDDPTQTGFNAMEHLQRNNETLTGERNQLQSSYEALSAERSQLEARMHNLSRDKDQWWTSYDSLTKEREELLASKTTLTAERDAIKTQFNNLKAESDQVQATYNTLKQQRDDLQRSYNTTQSDLEDLQHKYQGLTTSKDQLESIYSSVLRDKDQLQAKLQEKTRLLNNKTADRDELQMKLDNLTIVMDQRQSNYSTLVKDKDQLERNVKALNLSTNLNLMSYRSLWRENNQLQNSYNALKRTKDQLQMKYNNLTTQRDQLQRKTQKMAEKVRGLRCQDGWRKFDTSCYYISSTMKNWNGSRRACVERGADLVVIDSREEQVFVSSLLQQSAWIGLTDGLVEGTWVWVDGTPVTTEYWKPGQPNDHLNNQDCGEIVPGSTGGVGQWNDDGCFAEQPWICEK